MNPETSSSRARSQGNRFRLRPKRLQGERRTGFLNFLRKIPGEIRIAVLICLQAGKRALWSNPASSAGGLAVGKNRPIRTQLDAFHAANSHKPGKLIKNGGPRPSKPPGVRKIRSKFRLALLYLRFNLSAALSYRASFLSAAVGMFVSDASYIFFWWAVFRQANTVGGYDFRDVMFIWATGAAGGGLMLVLFGNVAHINELVLTGGLDTYLLQPRNVLLNLLMARTELTGFGDIAYGFAIMALTRQGLSGWLGFLLGATTGGLVMASVVTILQSTVFFLGNSSFLSALSMDFAGIFCFYPEGVFPKAVRFLLYWLIPAQFIVHVPLRIARGTRAALWLPAQILAAACFAVLALWIFHRGIKRYESGNLIVARL
jgi:ABC-2 type transport system permease protein